MKSWTDGISAEMFESIRDAAEKTGVRRIGIGQAANHKQETAGGFHWEFIGS